MRPPLGAPQLPLPGPAPPRSPPGRAAEPPQSEVPRPPALSRPGAPCEPKEPPGVLKGSRENHSPLRTSASGHGPLALPGHGTGRRGALTPYTPPDSRLRSAPWRPGGEAGARRFSCCSVYSRDFNRAKPRSRIGWKMWNRGRNTRKEQRHRSLPKAHAQRSATGSTWPVSHLLPPITLHGFLPSL